MPPSEKKVLFLGFGAVAQCTLPIFLKHVPRPAEEHHRDGLRGQGRRLGALDRTGGPLRPQPRRPREPRRRCWRSTFRRATCWSTWPGTSTAASCSSGAASGACSTSTPRSRSGTPTPDAEKKHPTEKTLYWRHMNIRRLAASGTSPAPPPCWSTAPIPASSPTGPSKGSSTSARTCWPTSGVAGAGAEEIRHWIDTGSFNRLARSLGVKVIHCSERDTQISDRPKEVDEFVNTWSIEGFREEGITTAEMGWGTHEKELPALACQHQDGPREPDLPGPHGHQHLGPLLGPPLQHPRHGHPPRRGLFDLRFPHRLGGRPGRLSPHRPLRLLPLRRRLGLAPGDAGI